MLGDGAGMTKKAKYVEISAIWRALGWARIAPEMEPGTLPRLGSRVRISSPAPDFFGNSERYDEGRESDPLRFSRSVHCPSTVRE